MTRCQMTFEELLNAYEGRADLASADLVRNHLAAGCPSCQQSWTWLQRVFSAAREMDRVPVPEWPVALATARFRERYARPERRTLLARLSFDSHLQPALAPARGDQELTRHQIYSVDDYDIELWQESTSPKACYLIGQVLPKTGDQAMPLLSVSIVDAQGDTLRITPTADDFHLPDVSTGVYEIRIEMPEGEIRLSDVVVGMQ
jgi:hypothetical protein